MSALLYAKDDQVMQLVNLAQQPIEIRHTPSTSDKLFTHYLDHF